MKTLKHSLIVWSGCLALLIFFALSLVLSPTALRYVAYGLVLGMSFSVILRWGKEAFYAARSGREGYDFLIISVFTSAATIFLQRLYIIYATGARYPDGATENYLSSLIPWVLAWSCTLALIAPGTSDGKINRVSKLFLFVAIFAAGVFSGASITVSLLTY